MQRLLRARALCARTYSTNASAIEKPAPPGDGPNHRSLLALDADTIKPYVQPNAFVAPNASVIGSVVINDKAAVMYGAVVRGDLALIHVGLLSVIGDNTTLHARPPLHAASPADAVATGLPLQPATLIGDFTIIGANCSVGTVTLKGNNVVGDGSVIEDDVTIGRRSVILPGSLVENGTIIPEDEAWGGVPARKVRQVGDDEALANRMAANERYGTTSKHMYEFLPVGTAFREKEALQRAQKQDAAA